MRSQCVLRPFPGEGPGDEGNLSIDFSDVHYIVLHVFRYTTLGSKKRNRDPKKESTSLYSLIGTAVVGIGVYVTLKQYLLQREVYNEAQSIPSYVERVTNAILDKRHANILHATSPYVAREQLRLKVKDELDKTFSDKFLRTAIVCGPRGCGKSTLIGEIFQNQKAVVPVHFRGGSADEFAIAVFGALKVSCPSNIQPLTLLVSALEEMKMQGHKMPVFVVEVDKVLQCKPRKPFITSEKLRHDNKLVQSVVILSSSRAAFGMKVLATELRATYITIDDLTHDESQVFCHAVEECEGYGSREDNCS